MGINPNNFRPEVQARKLADARDPEVQRRKDLWRAARGKKKSIERVLLPSAPTSVARMPLGAQFLGVGIDRSELGDLPFIWVLADVDAERVKHTYWVLGNGPHAPADLSSYIGSATTADGYDWHVFDGDAPLTD